MVKDFISFTPSFTILMLNVDFWVLLLGVLDGTAQFSALSKYLVPNGRHVLRKGVKLGGSATSPRPPHEKFDILNRTKHTYENFDILHFIIPK
jgi:hypothetical protein